MEFEARFKDLVPKLEFSRIDDQTGAAGEYWRIAGANQNEEAVQEFEILCKLAGQHLTKVVFGMEEFEKFISHSDPKIRWYRLLKNKSVNYIYTLTCYQTEEDGSKSGIHGGSIHKIANGSANLSLWLEANYPIKQHWTTRIYHDYGKELIVGIVLSVIAAILAT